LPTVQCTNCYKSLSAVACGNINLVFTLSPAGEQKSITAYNRLKISHAILRDYIGAGFGLHAMMPQQLAVLSFELANAQRVIGVVRDESATAKYYDMATENLLKIVGGEDMNGQNIETINGVKYPMPLGSNYMGGAKVYQTELLTKYLHLVKRYYELNKNKAYVNSGIDLELVNSITEIENFLLDIDDKTAQDVWQIRTNFVNLVTGKGINIDEESLPKDDNNDTTGTIVTVTIVIAVAVAGIFSAYPIIRLVRKRKLNKSFTEN
jgi:hypothetical protein